MHRDRPVKARRSRAADGLRVLRRRVSPQREPVAGPRGIALTRPQRVAFACAIGAAAAGVFVLFNTVGKGRPHGPLLGADFYQIWYMLHALGAGISPYVAGCPTVPPCADHGQYYPITAGIAVSPLGLLSAGTAAIAFVFLSTALLAYAVTRDGAWRVPALLSYPFVVAIISGQWAPLLVAASLTPGMEWLYAAKPQLGAVLFARWPSRRSFLLAGALVAVSLLVMPSWPIEWWRSAADSPYVRSPLLHFAWFAPILLLAAFRWRLPEARLLLAMSVVPQTPFAYDQLVLWLIPRSQREMMDLTWSSWLMFGAWRILSFDRDSGVVRLATFAPYLIVFLFLPCLVMVLRRPTVPSEGRSEGEDKNALHTLQRS